MIETIIYGLEVIRLSIIYRLVYKKRVINLWVPIILGGAYYIVFGLLFPNFNNSGKMALACTMAMPTMLFIIYGTWREKRGATLVIILISLVLEQCCSVPVKIADLYLDLETQIGNVANILVSLIGVGVLLCVYMWNRCHTTKEIEIISSKKLYVIVIILTIEMFVTSACLGYTRSYVPNIKYAIFAIIMVAISYLAIGTLGIFVVHIRKVYAEKEEMLQNEIMLKEMQQSYYETLLQKEEETRQYRHDLAGHLLCLHEFAQEENIVALKQYLQQMKEQVKQIQYKNYLTGNQVLDVITNHYLAAVEKEVKVVVKGQWESTLAIDNVMLCTIYSNLLKNAIEELERVEEDKKILQIEFLQGDKHCGIEIHNNIAINSKKKTSIFNTEKEDKKQHGLGLKNVKRAVKECGGQLTLTYNDKLFVARFSVKKKKE